MQSVRIGTSSKSCQKDWNPLAFKYLECVMAVSLIVRLYGAVCKRLGLEFKQGYIHYIPLRLTSLWCTPPLPATTSPLTVFSRLRPLIRVSRRSNADWAGWTGGSGLILPSDPGDGLDGAVWVVEALLTEARGVLNLETFTSGSAPSTTDSTVARACFSLSKTWHWWEGEMG